MEITKLEAKAYPLLLFEGVRENEKDKLLEVKEIQNTNGIITAKFGDVTTQVRVDKKNAEVWGRCTCNQYHEQPCIHIKSLAVHQLESLEESEEDEEEEDAFMEYLLKQDAEKIAKDIAKDAVVVKVEPVKVKPNATRDTPELGKKKAMNMVRSAQAMELQLIRKLDDLDEQIAIKDYVAGSAPLVYEIKTKNGVRYELSIRGWIQAMLYQGNIEIVDVKFEQTGDKTVAKAIVRDTARNIQTMGFAERVSNKEFFFTTLASKAIRNALKKVISPAFEQKVIKEAIEAKLVLTLTGLREVVEP
ncbi:hypothetical protein [Archaeoglobus profundus]|uniref:SWIM-type domain-containing protein n=1 Tax=Archaeoglobus profundus (strain DSM 5631 / JCM 9629 / NBRC 100127 / Av18) TaxID=572546 RepID=D2REL9_ARCPA|nr:hypothetical protein [Archaeoglobus profundus]ADB58563.1 hypothetical protein Arcpr_1517 [Archaeoglobus profundus DSM 5631]